MVRHFVDLFDLTSDDARELLRLRLALKREFADGVRASYLPGRTLGLIFEKPSLRTRVSFEAAMAQLGGNAIFLRDKDVGMGNAREHGRLRPRDQSVRGCAGRSERIAHATVEELAKHATVPIINALSDSSHPCQAMADMLTIQEAFGSLGGLSLVFVGDGNNVARSLALASALLGVQFVLAAPPGYEFPDDFRVAFAAIAFRRFPSSSTTIRPTPCRGGCGVHGRLGEHGPGT